MEHTSLPVAAHLFCIKDNKVLLLKRANTGFNDGKWSVPAGRVDSGESFKQAAVREAQEEVAIKVDPLKLSAPLIMHHKNESGERLYIFFTAYEWQGEPTNNEPNKCNEIKMFDISALPKDMLDHVRVALQSSLDDQHFTEWGF